MAQAVNVNVTANAAQLQAQMAVAQASLAGAERAMQRFAAAAVQAGQSVNSNFSAGLIAASANVQRYRGEIEQLSGAHDRLNFATAGVTREFIVMGHEIMMGNWSRLAGSAVVLTERIGGLQTVFSLFTAEMVVMAVPAALVTAGLAFIAYQAYETDQAIRATQGSLALMGQSGEASSTQLRTAISQVAQSYNLWESETAKALQTLSKAVPLTEQQRIAVLGAAAAAAAADKVPLSTVVEQWARAFEHGAAGGIKLAEQMRISTTEAEKMLHSGDAAGALAKVIDDITAAVDKNVGAWARAKAAFSQYIQGMSFIPIEGMDPSLLPKEPPYPSRTPSSSGNPVEQQMRSWMESHGYSPNATAGILGNASVESSFNPRAGEGTAHQGLFQWDSERVKGLNGNFDVANQMELMDKELQKLDPSFKFAAQSARELAARFEHNFEISGGQMLSERQSAAESLSQPGQQEAYGTKEAREAYGRQQHNVYETTQIAHRHAIDKQIEDAKYYTQEMESLYGKDSQQAQQAHLATARLVAKQQDEQVENTVAGFRSQENAAREYTNKIAAQQQIISTLQQAGWGDTPQMRAAQERMQTLQREMQAEQVQEQMRQAEAGTRVDSERLRTFEQQQKIMVDQKKKTTSEALQDDITYATQLHDQETKIYETVIASSQLTEKERAQMYERLAVLHGQYAERVMSFERQIADAARKSGDEIAKAFEKSFDTLGNSLSRDLGKLLTGQTTFAKAATSIGQQFGQTITEELTKVLARQATSAIAGMMSSTVQGAVKQAQGAGGTGLGALITSSIGVGQPGGILGSGMLSGGASDIAGGASLTAAGAALNASAAALTAAAATLSAGGATSSLGGLGGMAAMFGGSGDVAGALPDILMTALAFAEGGIVPSFAGGGISKGVSHFRPPGNVHHSIFSAAGGMLTPRVPGGQLSMLHANEMVLPSHLSQRIQNMAGDGSGSGGGATVVHFHGPTDAAAVSRWFRGNMGANPQVVRGMFRNQGLTARGLASGSR